MVELLLAILLTLTGIPRQVDAELTASAQRRAIEVQSDWSHGGWVYGRDGHAEIIAASYDADPVMGLALAWQGSPPHWSILTDPKYDRIGCAIAQVDTAFYGVCLFRTGSAPNVTQPTLPPPNVSNPPESNNPPAPSAPPILIPDTALEAP
jgi:hypothetical protein